MYPDIEEFWSDLAATYAEEVRRLAGLGCTYLQLDDTSLAYLNDPAQRAEIAARGYRKIYLMTGDRQPEAEELYLATGYTRLAGPLPSEGPVFPIAFEKWLA